MVNTARLFLSDYGPLGWGVTSPDLPSLVGGAKTRDELTDSVLLDMARSAGLSPHGDISLFFQYVFDCNDKVFAVRAKNDFYFGDRAKVAIEIVQQIQSDATLRQYAAEDALGDSVFIVALPTDRIFDILKSMELDQPATIACTRLGRREYLGAVHATSTSAKSFAPGESAVPRNWTVERWFASFDDEDLSTIESKRELVSV